MRDFLVLAGFVVNSKKVRRLLRLMGIEAIYTKSNLSKLVHAKHIKPHLLKGLKITRHNQVCGIDITYVPMRSGFMHLVAIIDHYSRYIVGWDVFNSLDGENSLSVLRKAIERNGKPEIINSGRGFQFTCAFRTEFNSETEIKARMDGREKATDNIFIERFWRTLKQGCVYLNLEENGTNLFSGLKEFINYYNTQKPHQGINSALPAGLHKHVA